MRLSTFKFVDTITEKERKRLEKWRKRWGNEKLEKTCECGGWLKPIRHIYKSYGIFDLFKCQGCGKEVTEPSDEGLFKVDGIPAGKEIADMVERSPLSEYTLKRDNDYVRLSRSCWASGDYVTIHERLDRVRFAIKADYHIADNKENCYSSGDGDTIEIFSRLSDWEIERAGQGYYDKDERDEGGFPKYKFKERELTENERKRAREKIELLKRSFSVFKKEAVKQRGTMMRTLFDLD